MPSRKKCKCKELPNVIEGTSSKGPSRHLVEIDRKSPPPALRGVGVTETGVELSSKYPVYLMKCGVCEQLWQCDAPTGIKVYCVPENWTARCIKVDIEVDWQNFDCTPIRINELVKRQDGHSDERCMNVTGKLLWMNMRCTNNALKGKAFCEFCLYHAMKDW